MDHKLSAPDPLPDPEPGLLKSFELSLGQFRTLYHALSGTGFHIECSDAEYKDLMNRNLLTSLAITQRGHALMVTILSTLGIELKGWPERQH